MTDLFIPPSPVLIWSRTSPPLGQGASGTPVLAQGAVLSSPWVPIGALTIKGYGFLGVNDTSDGVVLYVQNGVDGQNPDTTGPSVDVPAGGGGSSGFSTVTSAVGDGEAYARIVLDNSGGDADVYAFSLSLFTVPALESSNSGGSAPSTDTDWPIANPTGSTVVTQTPDWITGLNSATWVQFPAVASGLAYGLAGDDFPRIIFPTDPTYAVFFVGDGTFNPLESGAEFFLASTDGKRPPTLALANEAQWGGAILGNLMFTGLTEDPNGNLGGDAGDQAAATVDGSYALFVCTTGGDESSAVWTPFLTYGNEDPITAGAVPVGWGQLWLSSSDGTAWISTGTLAGDWVQLAGATDTGWIDASADLLNGWSASDGVARYRNLNGVVFLELAVAGGSSSIVLDLPAGFQPTVTGVTFPVEVQVTAASQVGLLTVEIGGGVNVLDVAGVTPSAIGNGTALVSFPADA